MDDNEDLRLPLENSWSWFRYHAEQRMTQFRFFLIAFGALAAGYVTLMEKELYLPALVAAVLVVVTARVFWNLDRRVSKLVRVSEQSLIEIQLKISEANGLKNFDIVNAAGKKENCPQGSYSDNFRSLYISLILSGILAAMFSVWRFFCEVSW